MLRLTLLIAAVAAVLLLVLVLALRAVRPSGTDGASSTLVTDARAPQTLTVTAELSGALPSDVSPIDSSAITPGAAPAAPGTDTVALSSTAASSSPTQDAGARVRFVQAVDSAPDTLNPILTTNATTQAVAQLIYPTFVALDEQDGRLSTSGLAVDWRVSPDARVYTYTVRSDRVWSDGVPVTADDVVFTLDAVREPATGSPFLSRFANVTAVAAPSPDTVVVTLATPECASMAAFVMPVLPAHRFSGAASLAEASQSTTPTVGAGPFLFAGQSGDDILLMRNPETRFAATAIQEFVLRVLPTPEAQLAALEAGTVDLAVLTGAWVGRAQAVPNHTLQLIPEDSFDFVALNLADPAAPLPGRDENAAVIPQPAHPILGEIRVRQALAAAIDYDAVLPAAVLPAAYRVASYVLPTAAWAADTSLTPVQTNPTLAGELLDSVGWRDEDGDGRRTRDGVPLALTLLVNNDSDERLDAAQAIAAAWRAVGVDVTVEAASYEDVSQRVLAQQTDVALLGWDNLGFDPGANPFWHSRHDSPGSGFNFVSYQDAAVDAWLDDARIAPGCDAAIRAERFRQVQAQVDGAKPYLMLHGRLRGWVVSDRWQGVEIGPWQPYASLDAWRPRE